MRVSNIFNSIPAPDLSKPDQSSKTSDHFPQALSDIQPAYLLMA